MIDTVSSENLHEVLPLIRQYQEFYHVANISDEKNAMFFSQFGNASSTGCQFVFYDFSATQKSSSKNKDVPNKEKIPVGFATIYFSFSSTLAEKVAVLNDVFVLPSYRGRGIGRELIEHCHVYGKAHGAARLQWVTAPDNHAAQALYDSMGANKSHWCFYTYSAPSFTLDIT